MAKSAVPVALLVVLFVESACGVTTTVAPVTSTTLFPTATYPSSGLDMPVFSQWSLTASVASAATYASTCSTACIGSKPCPRGTMMCFGKKHQGVPGAASSAPSSWPAALPCDCSSSTVKRWPGVFCGPRMASCSASATWVDGLNTIIQGCQGTTCQ